MKKCGLLILMMIVSVSLFADYGVMDGKKYLQNLWIDFIQNNTSGTSNYGILDGQKLFQNEFIDFLEWVDTTSTINLDVDSLVVEFMNGADMKNGNAGYVLQSDGDSTLSFVANTPDTVWTRSGTTLSPTNSGDDIDMAGGKIDNAQLELSLAQGLAWDQANDTYERLGSIAGIAASASAGDDYLPIQSDMRRCLLNDDGTVNYYIDADDGIMKDGTTVAVSDTADGTTANKLVDSGADFVTDGVVAGMYVHNTTDDTYSIITAVDDLNTLSLKGDIFVSGELYDIGTADFSGTDGQVMVEIPKFYYKQWKTGDIFYWYMSKYDLAGFELHEAFWKDGQEVDYRYMSAFEGSMYDSSEVAMTASGSIATDLYASGDKMCSVAGQWAKVNETRTEFRAMAAERGTGWRQLDYYLHSAVQLLYLVEYADFNSQDVIGMGRTELSGGSFIADSYIGFTGYSVPDGNGSNSVSNGTTNGYLTDYMTYRGIENLYGNIDKMIDGITWDGRWTGSAAAQPVYVTNNSDYFQDAARVNMQHLCDASYIGVDYGYIGNLETVAGFIPSDDGGGATSKVCDDYSQYSKVENDYWRMVAGSGNACGGGTAGVFSLSARLISSYAWTNYSSRLCF